MAENTTVPNAAPPLPLPTTLGSETTTAEPAAAPLTGFAVARRLVTVNTHVNDGSGGAEQPSFSVDVEQVPGLVEQHEKARDKLHDILRKTTDLQQVEGPGTDEVSQKLPQPLGDVTGEDPGKLAWVVNKTIERLG
ncbi:hypothetical protein GCM10027174_25290 [Salinifilum aidingensis]